MIVPSRMTRRQLEAEVKRLRAEHQTFRERDSRSYQDGYHQGQKDQERYHQDTYRQDGRVAVKRATRLTHQNAELRRLLGAATDALRAKTEFLPEEPTGPADFAIDAFISRLIEAPKGLTAARLDELLEQRWGKELGGPTVTHINLAARAPRRGR